MIETAKKLVIFVDFGVFVMKNVMLLLVAFCSFTSFAQDNEELLLKAKRLANNFVYEGNEKIQSDDFTAAEMDYRKAISEENANIAGIYNLGTSYYKKGKLEESLYRLQEAAKKATNRQEKHKVYHNIGNILMQDKKCKEAVEAYKNALRNNPSDEETRYNFGLAKECAEQQKQDNQNNEDNQDQNKDQQQDNKDQNQDQNQDKQDQDQDKKDEGDQKDQDQKDEGDQDKNEGDQKENEDGKPKDDKQDQGQGDQDKKEQPQQPKPQQGKMSPQQIKNLLEAMNNQEQKVQEKINAEKQKGERIQTDKDW